MDYTGIRTLDKVGRVIIPAKARTKLNLVEGETPMRCYVEGGRIVFEPVINIPTCMFSGAKDDLIEVDGTQFISKQVLHDAVLALKEKRADEKL